MKDESVVFMVPSKKNELEVDTLDKAPGLDHVPVSFSAISEFANQYTGFELETIEVYVQGAAETEGVTKLFVSMSGEAGIRLVFNKKKEQK